LGAMPEAVGIISVPTRKILPKRAIIGVNLASPNEGPARIATVMPGTGAAKAGLKAGDIVLSVNGKPVNKGAELSDTLRQFRDGQAVKLRIQRDEEKFDADVVMTL